MLNDVIPSDIQRPLILPPNRVRRSYRGGKLLETYRRQLDPADDYYPEDWVGSTVMSRSAENPVEGLSWVDLAGRKVFLRDLVNHHPEFILGAAVGDSEAGINLLVKLLDSSTRLRIQVHPTREKAAKLLDSPVGKTESWIVMETRKINGEDPYILFGFKEGVTEEAFREAVMSQNTEKLVEILHRIPVQPGDVFFVEAGVPHAIGPGIFMTEVQEPSDFTIVVEPKGTDLLKEEADATLGLGWDGAFSCFDYHGLSLEATLARWKKAPTLVRKESGGAEFALLDGRDVTPFFRARKLSITGELAGDGAFYIAVVVNGQGQVVSDGSKVPVSKGDTLLIPAGLGTHTWQSTSGEVQPLEVLTCYPPSKVGK